MSDTTSFLGGAAFAGLAALFLLKGGVTVGTPSIGTPQVLPAPTISPAAVAPVPVAASPTPVACPSPASGDGSASSGDVEQLKTVLEQQKTDMDKLKTQVQDQKSVIDTLTAQAKANVPTTTAGSAQALSANEQLANPILTGLLWALGGVALTLGGGIVLVGMFVLVARQQNQRSPRTVEVIHTAHDMPDYLSTRRQRPVLPARRVVKRANPPEHN